VDKVEMLLEKTK